MITLLWLIRSTQGILHKHDSTIWDDDWFLGIIFTILCVLFDLALVEFAVFVVGVLLQL